MPISESDYKLHADGRFLIRDYQRKKPFSNFLPGIAGLYGTPMWVFYVNRGQGVASFGTRNKDNAILEFFPANKAYQAVTRLGFRTFIKLKTRGKKVCYEPFKPAPGASEKSSARQTMEVASHEFSVEETNPATGLKISVRYWTLPGESLAALVREVTLTNLSGDAVELEIADGLPAVNPFGMNEFFVKNMSRTIEAWMIVENLEKKSAFYRLKVDAADRPEVEVIQRGNFYFSFVCGASGTKLSDPIVDPAVLFGPRLDFSEPELFYSDDFSQSALLKQATGNKTPCAFSISGPLRLGPKKSVELVSFFGHAESRDELNRFAASAKRGGKPEAKRLENRSIIENIKSRMFTVSSSIAYDLYCGQTYLDNVIRGGLPISFGGRRGASQSLPGPVFYVYSRKHGDLERDYNRFLVEPAYFSQGDGNYRDVNQNRRNDVWFEPRVKDANIRTFLNLVQLDGFNPLVLKGSQFHLKRSKEALKVLARSLQSRSGLSRCEVFLSRPFDPGSFCRFLEVEGLMEKTRFGEFFASLLPWLEKEERAEHGEGFWIDHWTYNLDLIESYFAVYPEDKVGLLLTRKEFTFYDSDHHVRPRSEKYFEKKKGAIRQYRSVTKDPEKAGLLGDHDKELNLVKTRNGRGQVYRTTLFVKLLCLFVNKLASLDAEGTGIQMDADKPSWLDALNGLPGLLGSSICETFELKRLTVFLAHALEDLEVDLSSEAELPEELHLFIRKVALSLEEHRRDRSASACYQFWRQSQDIKERFRAQTRLGLSGKENRMKFSELKALLEHAREKIDIGLEKAFDVRSGKIPTYFENVVTRYRLLKSPKGPKTESPGWPLVDALEFKQKALPLFLEGPVHALKVENDPERRRALVKAVRQSRLYDAKLGMYKVSESLEGVSLEVGRSRVFNPGWLENESVWLHMEYKFLLEMLKGGMDEEFFKEFKKVLIPYQSPERYGRSPLENSSFIVSSAFPDKSLHGAGFVARLSGSTAEFLTMWLLMNVGKRPFIVSHDKKLSLRFEPHLPAFLFTREETTRDFEPTEGAATRVVIPGDSFAFLFLNKTLVVYHNPRQLDTFGKLRASVKKIKLSSARGLTLAELKGDTVPSPFAARIRDEVVPRIDIELG